MACTDKTEPIDDGVAKSPPLYVSSTPNMSKDFLLSHSMSFFCESIIDEQLSSAVLSPEKQAQEPHQGELNSWFWR